MEINERAWICWNFFILKQKLEDILKRNFLCFMLLFFLKSQAIALLKQDVCATLKYEELINLVSVTYVYVHIGPCVDMLT